MAPGFVALLLLLLAAAALGGAWALRRAAARRRAAEQALGRSETSQKMLLEQFPAVLWTVDPELRFTSSTGAALQALGLKPGEVVGRTLLEFFGTDDRDLPPIAAHIRALGGESVSYETSWGGRLYQSRLEPFRAEDGRITGVIGVAYDVTDMKEAYAALAKSMERYHDLVQDLEGIVWEADPDLRTGPRFTFVSRKAEAILGHPARRFLDEPGFWLEIVHPEDRDRVLATLRRVVVDRRPHHVEYRARHADGRCLLLRMSLRPVGGPGGQAALRGLILDVTEQDALQREALRAQKLDSIGLLAGGLAHDFNNLLHGILGHLSLARVDPRAPEEVRGQLASCEQGVRRAQDLTARLLTFARGGAPVRRIASIAELLRETVDFSLRGSAVEATVVTAPGLWNAAIDEAQVSQVFGNLTLNALQAMPRGGHLVVQAENVRLTRPNHLPLRPGPYVRVTFQDEGIGIPPQDLARIFEPYFTTKEEGSGLGLATAWSVLRRHEGHIAVESEAGHGATFTLHLPATGESSGDEEADPVGARLIRGHGRLLVVDDEPMIRDLLRDLLEHLGYEVETVAEGGEAVRRYDAEAEAGRPFDLVILDLTIRGGLGGREAFERIRGRHPRARAIVSSGYSNDPIMAHHRECGFAGVLSKPYTLEDLSALLAQVLAEEP
jgi:two-component system cell cycle sensor histidine kinase/response regulator CckA